MAVRLRRLLASALVLLLTGAPAAAATCALACPMPTTATRDARLSTGEMPADCARMHHDAVGTTPAGDAPTMTPAPVPDAPCCGLSATPAEAPRAFATGSPQAMVGVAPAAIAATCDVTAVSVRGHAPPAPGPGPIGRARRTDILRL